MDRSRKIIFFGKLSQLSYFQFQKIYEHIKKNAKVFFKMKFTIKYAYEIKIYLKNKLIVLKIKSRWKTTENILINVK